MAVPGSLCCTRRTGSPAASAWTIVNGRCIAGFRVCEQGPGDLFYARFHFPGGAKSMESTSQTRGQCCCHSLALLPPWEGWVQSVPPRQGAAPGLGSGQLLASPLTRSHLRWCLVCGIPCWDVSLMVYLFLIARTAYGTCF